MGNRDFKKKKVRKIISTSKAKKRKGEDEKKKMCPKRTPMEDERKR